ncbi:ABC-type sugar transport system substrate-binding protein [Saccharothrix tamanrassetensis]|uniref:ABC-type sugar transport system substrate-binding protein n=1 Tax=Saccharothrix tamanrassetensis TaxID=1051531 RepID=A0A841CUL9_9PSEU|nr:substrate-binding domain-containing protein [Saccharothrix tamanrassetensis]MBB5960523.1 ABC-type sugar transport system substrate-binding protein [Saccharothrix tamanrassetensis]
MEFRGVAALSALTLALTACGSGTSSGGGGDLTIGLAISTLDNPYFVALKAGAEKAAAELGVELTVVDAQNDATNQVNQVQTFTTQGVKAIVINPVDSKQAAPAAKAAENAAVPLVAVDRSVDEGKVVSEVASDNVQGGTLAAIELGRAVSGQVVHLQGIPGASASRDRGRGFEQGLNSGGIEVVAGQPADFNRAKGLDVMTNLLQANPGVKGVFADNDEMALGAIKALGDRAGKDVQVVGFDGTPDGLTAIENGTMAATIAQQPEVLGRKAVEQAVKAARGETVQEVVDVEVKVVTKKNVAEFRK